MRRYFWASGLLFGLFLSTGVQASSQQSAAPGASAPIAQGQLPDDPSARVVQDRHVDIAMANAPPPDAGKPVDNDDVLAQGRQTKRILYIVPNFRAVSANAILPPQPVKEKLNTAIEDSFDYSSFVFVGLQSGLGMMNKSYPEFRQGAAGYSRYYWHTFADSTDENLWVEFVIPVALRQDTRYYTLGNGGLVKRFTYAFTRIAVTRTDEGNNVFNASEILGAGAAAALSNFYYPSQERTEVKTYQRWVTNVLIDGGTFVFKEFWPDINNTFFHQKS